MSPFFVVESGECFGNSFSLCLSFVQAATERTRGRRRRLVGRQLDKRVLLDCWLAVSYLTMLKVACCRV